MGQYGGMEAATLFADVGRPSTPTVVPPPRDHAGNG